MTATRSGSWMPRPRRNTASTMEYTAVVIATPAASERIAKVVKRGVAPSRLSASLMSRPTAVEGSTPGYRPHDLEAAAGVEMPSVVGEHRMADVRVHDDVAHAVDDAGVHQHEPISLEVDARFGAQLDHRGDLPRERPAEREAESGCDLPRWIVQRV